MQKVSYMGNDETTEFYFNFPYFETSNVVVTKNGAPATGYNIIGNSGGLDADYPFIGGKVVFDIAPTSLESITIARQLPLARIADYQPLAQITPTTLNQDLNYLMEVIKDRKDELTDLITKYSEIADKESTEVILSRITAIHEEITDIDAKIQALGDIGTLEQRVTDLTTTVGSHTTSIGALDTTVSGLNTTVGGHTTSINGLDTRTNGMIDYVIESQAPTAENNYTWYRKYKSGWVEQGGFSVGQSGNTPVVLPIEMADPHYHILAEQQLDYSSDWNANTYIVTSTITATGFSWRSTNSQHTNGLHWKVSGMANQN